MSKFSRIHIIGAGIAGLAAGVRLSHLGQVVSIYEAAPRAGGRCRSYHDAQLDCVIDNGNHLMMSGNHAVAAYLKDIGATDRLTGPPNANFPFVDVSTGERWCLRPGRGVIPWWIFDASRRVPRTTPREYLSALRILNSSPDETVTDCVASNGPLYKNFWEPLTVAALNTDPQHAAAQLMRPVLTETFLRGSTACRPLIACHSLANALVDPAVELLTANGAEMNFGSRVKALSFKGERVSSLELDSGSINIAQRDLIVVATPPWIAETLIPELVVPPPGEPIVNVHYRLPHTLNNDEEIHIVGVIGGLAQWVFVRGDLVSTTISAAADTVELPADEISSACWRDVAKALNIESSEPPSRVVKERRATFAQTPSALKMRPKTATNHPNLLLAGDWTATGVPATIEGAVRSGFRAAKLAADRTGVAASKSSTHFARKQTEAA
jgi:hydroxysqualene dehydroxylase